MSSPFINPMHDYVYYGVVCYDNHWRYFGDYDRGVWGLDFSRSEAEAVPEKRRQLLTVDRANVERYCSLFDAEFTADEIRTSLVKVELTFIVNFDLMLFVDGGGEEGEHWELTKQVPPGWFGLNTRDPFEYVPTEIRDLWITKEVICDATGSILKVLIHPYTFLGAVKYQGSWRIFFDASDTWRLDYDALMKRNGMNDWLTNPHNSDWRKQLPKIDVSNADRFLELLSDRELELEELPYLEYSRTEDIQTLIEMCIEDGDFDWVRRLTKPQLRFVIDFDDRICGLNFGLPSSSYQTDKPVYVPDGWTIREDDSRNYVPDEISRYIG